MIKRAVQLCVSFVLLLGMNITILWANEPGTVSNKVMAHNEPSETRELLMFFEEQDLVTATKRPTSLRKAPAIATVITADEIRNMGARNLLDVLKMVPGFGISINEFNGMMVEVRGIRTGTSEKILVMIDGHSLNRNINGSALYRVAGTLPLENVRQVEVIRGPGSALYGNSAFVATINIITRTPEEISGLELKGGGGSFDSIKGNFVGGSAINDKLAVAGSLDHFRSSGPELKIEADTLSGTPYSMAPGTTDLRERQTDAFLKVGYGDLSLRGHYLTKRQGMNVGIVSALTDKSSETKIDNYWGELAYQLHLASDLSANLKLTYDYYEQDPNMKIYPNGFRGLFPEGMIGKPVVKDRTLGGELQVDWDVFTGNHLIAGVSFEGLQQYDVRQLANFDPLTGAPLGSVQEVANWNKNGDRQIFATYLQDEWQLPAQVNLTAGLRYDHYSDFGDTVNPRVGMFWNFMENLDLKLLYGQAFRAPTFQELYNINNSAVVGNPDLKPERIQTYEAGLAWRLNRFFAANANYFLSIIKDQIGWIPSTTAGKPAVNTNLNKSETQGVEVSANGAIGDNCHWQLSYAYQDPRDTSTDQRLPFVPSQRALGSVNYALSKYVNLHTDVHWTGARSRPQGDIRPKMPHYATVDVTMTLKNLYKSLELQVAVHNLLDESYYDLDTSVGAVNMAKTGAKVPGDFPREGIAALVTALYRF